KGNVIVVGLGINMLVPAIAGYILKVMGKSNLIIPEFNTADLKINIPLIKDIPILGDLVSGHSPLTYISFILIIVMSILMYRTKFGVYVRVVGENEDSAISLGLKTNFYKYMAIGIGAVCCALAGINLSVEGIGLYTNNMTAGRGFIAIAAIYCGGGSPAKCSIFALLFGLARSLAINMQLNAGPEAALFDIIPYVVMTVVLAVIALAKARKRMERSF
ncbi:MAG: ABC transporter permease, partial [Parasporobacterium sp.]|nr:ABC transporter permease [Parasporobacterium sp.]